MARNSAGQEGVVAAGRIRLPVAVPEGQGALPDALEHEDVERAVHREVDGRVQPVRGESRAAANSEVTCHGVGCRFEGMDGVRLLHAPSEAVGSGIPCPFAHGPVRVPHSTPKALGGVAGAGPTVLWPVGSP